MDEHFDEVNDAYIPEPKDDELEECALEPRVGQ